MVVTVATVYIARTLKQTYDGHCDIVIFQFLRILIMQDRSKSYMINIITTENI